MIKKCFWTKLETNTQSVSPMTLLCLCINKPVADTAALQSDRWVGSLAANATCRAALTLAGLTHGVVVKPLDRTWQHQSTDTTLCTYTTPLT